MREREKQTIVKRHQYVKLLVKYIILKEKKPEYIKILEFKIALSVLALFYLIQLVFLRTDGIL